MNRHLLLPLSSALVLLSCTDDMLSPLPAEPDAAAPCPMSGVMFRLGSADELASPEERVGWTRFRHDLRMDRTEMTQREYTSLLGRNPSTLRGDSLPVTDVSWYDAALAANARSRRDGLDTVYEYASVLSDAQGDASGLECLTIHLDRSGWRLPTEAEWEAAARGGASTPWAWGGRSDSDKAETYAWYQKNAGGRTHPVAAKSPNAWGLHDMAGNVMEWVNDWKGSFPKDTVEEFAGQESPGDVPEVPLKGGSYNYGLSQLRPSSRTATYAAYRSSRAEYVGFRLCRGGFVARYVSASGDVVYTPPVTLVRTDVPRLASSWEARLVFVNRAGGKGTLTWIDYGESNPVARSLPDKDPVFHPVISPDGRWVAWSTALEGSTGASRIKARRLAKNDTTVLDLGEGAIPRWWVSGADTFLIAGDARDNLASGWSGTKTIAWRWSNGVLSNPATWSSEGSYHDGRSGPYLYTGYRRLRQHDVRTGTSRILFTAPANGKASGDTSQVCNVSAAPDSSGRAMFLDFGYTGTSSVVKRAYGIHEIAFVVDSTGRVLNTIPSPSGEAQWEHLEWSNAPKWAVSGAIDGTGAYRNLYLVDLGSATSTRIVSGEQLWQPALWVGRSSVLPKGAVDLDSMGRYGTVVNASRTWATVSMDEFGAKASAFWFRNDSIEYAFIGSSQVAAGIREDAFTHGVAFNWGVSGMSLFGDVATLEKYVLPHCPRLRAVGISIMPAWDLQNDGTWVWTSIRNSVGFLYDSLHGFWRDGRPEGFDDAVRANASPLGVRLIAGIQDEYAGAGWGTSQPNNVSDDKQSSAAAGLAANLKLLDRTATALEGRGIRLVLVNFPQSPWYRKTEYSGYFGPKWDLYRLVMDSVRAVASRHPGVVLYDAYQDGSHDYDSLDFLDAAHLSTSGARKISRRLDSMLRSTTR